MTDRDLIDEQIAYYRARAPEYDEWYMRRGRYAITDEAEKQQWWDEVADVKVALDVFRPKGDVLEVACGTGWWTEILFPYCDTLTAVDAAPEAIALNKERLQADDINYIESDIFSFEPDRAYDVVFLGFWLSHVPDTRFDSFWEMVRRALKPNGRWYFVDTRKTGMISISEDSFAEELNTPTQRRTLNDGRSFNMVKVLYDPSELDGRLSRLGWTTDISETDRYFIYGSGEIAATE